MEGVSGPLNNNMNSLFNELWIFHGSLEGSLYREIIVDLLFV